MRNSGAGNITESFVLDNLRILVNQNIFLNKPTSFRDSYYLVESNCSDKCNIPIYYNTLLNVVHKNMQRDNDKNTNSPYPKSITVTQGASTNTSERVTVTLLLLLLLLLLSIYFVLTSVRIYNKNLYSSSFKLIQVNITKKYTKKLKC